MAQEQRQSIWLSSFGLNLFEILCQFVLCRAAACKAERESVKQQEHQAFSRHNVQLTRMKHQLHEESSELDHSRTYCPTVLDETVKRRLVDVLWATKICQVFVDLAEAQNADSSTDQT